jgi:hypothetical protein
VIEVKVRSIQQLFGGGAVLTKVGTGRWYPVPNDPKGRGTFYFNPNSAPPINPALLVVGQPYALQLETPVKTQLLVQNAIYMGPSGPNNEYLEFTKS